MIRDMAMASLPMIMGVKKKNFIYREKIGYYEGQFMEDRIEGFGRLVNKIGEWYEGSWVGNEKSGVGKFGFLNGDVYSGGFLKDLPHGCGEMSYYDGGVYRGELREGVKWGEGIDFWPSGKIKYKGCFRDNLYCNFGEYYDRDLKHGHYRGRWRDGRYHGQGVLSWDKHEFYSGNFHHGARQGRGFYQWAEDVHYNGRWVDGKRNGHGLMKNSKGNVYTGEFKNNEYNGIGVDVCKNGDVYKGKFNHGLLIKGTARCTMPDGVIWEGEYIKGHKHGIATEYDVANKENRLVFYQGGRRRAILEGNYRKKCCESGCVVF
jgi:hypothetical protein